MEKRDEIIEAAIECFSSYGYSKTSMSDIGRKVNLNKASLYYHFKDKQALYEAVIARLRTSHFTALRKELDEAESGKAPILLFIKKEIDFIRDLSLNFMAGNSGNEYSKSDTAAVYENIIAEDVSFIAYLLVKQELCSKTDAEQTARLLFNTARGLLMVNCPLDLPLRDRSDAYDRLKNDVEETVGLILSGLAVQ